MAANLPSNASTSKAASAAPPQLTPTLSQGSSTSAGDSHPHRRSGGSGSVGAGAASRSAHAAGARNKQASRNQHKQSRKYRLTDEDAIAESAAMTSSRNRRGQTSITHLMNFSLPPRPSHFQNQHNSNTRHSRRNLTWGVGSGHHAVDKARYVHANYRFIVDPRHDYRAQAVDADVYLDWAHILQILASPQSQAAACPICLGDPVAPRMAKCGHMFCLHCLIRYMHSTDDETAYYADRRPRWKKCPICWDAIYISETRPVRWYIGQEGPSPREKEDIVLRLVMRPAGSTLALPRDAQQISAEQDIPWHFAANVMDYARFMKGSEDYMIEQYDQEILQLDEVEKHDELMFGEDTEWTSRAIRAVNEAKERIKGLGNPPSPLIKPEEPKPQKRPPPVMELHEDTPEMYLLQHATKSGQSIPSNPPQTTSEGVASEEPAASEAETKNQPKPTSPPKSALSTSLAEFRAQQHSSHHQHSDYYFYQALLHYYLSPLDIRILKVAFGDFALFPSTILPRVERISTGHVIDDDLRKRAKYLSHLPYGCEVGFLECDWTDTVPADVLEKFKPDIERRRKKNLDKETREEKERVRAEKVEEDKRYAAARRRRPNSPSSLQLQPDDFQPLAAAAAAATATAIPAAEQASDPAAQSLESGAESVSPLWQSRTQNGSAFASLASPSTSPSTSRTVWGTAAITQASPTLAPIRREVPAADDGWLQGWEKDLLSEEDLVTQVEAASLEEGKPKAGGGAGPAKKKKGKKITLMSTSNARRGA